MAGLAAGGGDRRPVTEDDLAGLPETVQRYLHAMGVVNRPRDWSFQAHITGRFRLRGQGSWMPAEVWQYNSAGAAAGGPTELPGLQHVPGKRPLQHRTQRHHSRIHLIARSEGPGHRSCPVARARDDVHVMLLGRPPDGNAGRLG